VTASSLPPADIIKVDTEGCEVEILRGADLSTALLVMYEYHRTEDRITLDQLMRDHGFVLVGGIVRSHWLGTMKWLRRGPGVEWKTKGDT